MIMTLKKVFFFFCGGGGETTNIKSNTSDFFLSKQGHNFYPGVQKKKLDFIILWE